MAIKWVKRKKVNPAELIYTGTGSNEKVETQLFEYNSSICKEIDNPDLGAIEFKNTGLNYWLNIHGIHDVELVNRICLRLGIHGLVVQDILDVSQPPKFQVYDDYLFFTFKSVIPDPEFGLYKEQISFVLGRYFLLSFQERKADYFNHVRERLRKNLGKVREREPDYLLYLLIESVLENYLITLNDIDMGLDGIEIPDTEKEPSPVIIQELEKFRKDVYSIKKMVFPVDDFLIRIEKESDLPVNERHLKYFQELKDLGNQIQYQCEKLEVRIESISNLFFSVQGYRNNQIMKFLTVVASLFIPLTFIVGIYGMNFTYMPELGWRYGYPAVWIVMILVTIGSVIYFRWKRWL
ncbi:MAG: magnesium/cobalt transporter CorA [Bacteroidales bacterium]